MNVLISTIKSFFDGVSMKTVLLCILGMTMVMKLNRPPPQPIDPNHGVHPSNGVESPGVRGAAVLNVGVEDKVLGEGGGSEGGELDPQAQALIQQVDSQQGYATQDQQPPPPQQQGLVPQQGGAGNLQPATSGGYAVGQTSTYDQSPLAFQQQQMQAQAGQQQLGQFGTAVDASQMSPPQTLTGDPEQPQDGSVPAATTEGGDASNVPDASQSAEGSAASVPLVESPPAASTGGGDNGASLLGLLNNFKDAWDAYDKTDIPMFWHSE